MPRERTSSGQSFDFAPIAHGRAGSFRAYGAKLADCFGLPEPPSHVTRTLRHGLFAVSELQTNVPLSEPTAPLGYDDAFLLTVQLKDIADHEYWLDGQSVRNGPIRAGMTYVHDLRKDPRALVRQPAHAVHFYMPLAALNGFAEQEGFAAINDLNHEPGAGRNDPVMSHLTQATMESLARPHEASGSFLDHILCAVCARTLGNYGTSRAVFRSRTGGLAQWQERRAKELMRAGMDGNVPLSQLAQECRLSVTHFVRTFRESTGMSPHQWLLSLRVDRAKSLLEGSGLSLAEVALECGFHDQSHLTRAFMAHVGVSPGCWRRVRARGPIVDHPK